MKTSIKRLFVKYLFKREEREMEKGNQTREWINDKKKLLTFINEAEFSIYLEKKSGQGRTSHIKPVELLVKAGADVNAKNNEGYNALESASVKVATKMTKLRADLLAYSFDKSETDKHFYHKKDKTEFIHEQKKLEVLKEEKNNRRSYRRKSNSSYSFKNEKDVIF